MTTGFPGQIVTLTTDFGSTDSYVGTLKGAILTINPQATIVDISHQIPSYDISSGAFQFSAAFRHFPTGTIHILVVDPGVGTNRLPILVVAPNAYFLCPDNGILSHCFFDAGSPSPQSKSFSAQPVSPPHGWQAYHLTNQEYWRNPVSNTFHGRDIFAPAAAYLSRGVPPNRMGTLIDHVQMLPIPLVASKEGRLVGTVLSVDRFGNLITNISADLLAPYKSPIVIGIGGHRLHGLSTSYQDGTPLLAIIGSHGNLEIGFANGNAQTFLGVNLGAEVSVSQG